jgi:hypothetical protein
MDLTVPGVARLKNLLTAALLLGAAACGGGGSTAPAPVAAAPTITTTNSTIYVGESVQFAATGTGTIRWGGDSPGVASVNATSGLVTGAGNGRVTIWAENEGGRTTRLLRVMPLFAGIWRGGYVVEDCQAEGTFAAEGFCGTSVQIGQRLEIQLIFFQTAERIHGATFNLRPMPGFTFSMPRSLTDTTVREDGEIRLAGFGQGIPGMPTKVNLENIRMSSPSPGVIEGRYEQFWSTGGGSARVFARFDNVIRELPVPMAR